MKLNKDCIRQILLATEKNNYVEASLTPSTYRNSFNLSEYNEGEIAYCIARLGEGNFLNVTTHKDSYDRTHYVVNSLTYSGHEFLDTIRDDNIWKETKEVASKVSGVSIPLILDIAKSLIEKNVLNL